MPLVTGFWNGDTGPVVAVGNSTAFQVILGQVPGDGQVFFYSVVSHCLLHLALDLLLRLLRAGRVRGEHEDGTSDLKVNIKVVQGIRCSWCSYSE